MTDFKAEIGIICAMQIEADGLREALSDAFTVKVSGADFYCGTLSDVNIAVAVCGVGKVFAALCTEAMILKFSPKVIINSGVAGGLSESLSICDAAIADFVCQHDMDTSPLGDPVGLISGINLVKIPCDKRIAVILSDCVKDEGIHLERGVIASGDQFISSADKKARIVELFGAIACEMEGAAVGHVCYVNGVPCGVLRTISDGGDDSAQMDFPVFAKKAAANSIAIMKRFVTRYKNGEN